MEDDQCDVSSQAQKHAGLEGNEEDFTYGDDASDEVGYEEEEEELERTKGGKGREGEAAWRNSEGERLKDFGVDEDVEFYDEQDDDLPLSELIARRQAAAAAAAAAADSH